MYKEFNLPTDRFEGKVGTCTKCKGKTLVLSPCCGANVEYNSVILKSEYFKSWQASINQRNCKLCQKPFYGPKDISICSSCY